MNNKPLILIVEDDAPIRNLISVTLETHEYRHITAGNAGTAIMEATSHNPDIMLLDLGLPDMDGVEVIRKIRSWSNMPIIVISARSDDADKIEALDAEHFHQTVIHINIEFLKIDYAAGCAYLSDEELHLTPIEYKLLCLLARNCGKVLTHKYITQEVWGASWETNGASLRVFMATLRKKLEASPDASMLIQTHVGIGYRMIRITDN